MKIHLLAGALIFLSWGLALTAAAPRQRPINVCIIKSLASWDNRLNDIITSHIQNVYKDFSDVRVSLYDAEPNLGECDIVLNAFQYTARFCTAAPREFSPAFQAVVRKALVGLTPSEDPSHSMAVDETYEDIRNFGLICNKGTKKIYPGFAVNAFDRWLLDNMREIRTMRGQATSVPAPRTSPFVQQPTGRKQAVTRVLARSRAELVADLELNVATLVTVQDDLNTCVQNLKNGVRGNFLDLTEKLNAAILRIHDTIDQTTKELRLQARK